MSTITLIALEPDGYSNCEGDYWQEHPADIDFLDGLSVGDEYELTVCLNAWTETYRVVKAPDTDDDDYEVERVPNQGHRYVTTDQAEAYADARVREARQWVSVDDRLPDVPPGSFGGTRVLAFWTTTDPDYDPGGIETSFFDGRNWQGANGEMDYHGSRRVSHWMQLPEPPTE